MSIGFHLDDDDDDNDEDDDGSIFFSRFKEESYKLNGEKLYKNIMNRGENSD